MTSSDLVKLETNTKATKKRTSIRKNEKSSKAGSVHENSEISPAHLDEVLLKNNFYMDSAMQINSNDQTVRNKTVEDLNDFNSQSLATQANKSEQLVSKMPAIEKFLN